MGRADSRIIHSCSFTCLPCPVLTNTALLLICIPVVRATSRRTPISMVQPNPNTPPPLWRSTFNRCPSATPELFQLWTQPNDGHQEVPL